MHADHHPHSGRPPLLERRDTSSRLGTQGAWARPTIAREEERARKAVGLRVPAPSAEGDVGVQQQCRVRGPPRNESQRRFARGEHRPRASRGTKGRVPTREFVPGTKKTKKTKNRGAPPSTRCMRRTSGWGSAQAPSATQTSRAHRSMLRSMRQIRPSRRKFFGWHSTCSPEEIDSSRQDSTLAMSPGGRST